VRFRNDRNHQDLGNRHDSVWDPRAAHNEHDFVGVPGRALPNFRRRFFFAAIAAG
jgi:hypothetical protein